MYDKESVFYKTNDIYIYFILGDAEKEYAIEIFITYKIQIKLKNNQIYSIFAIGNKNKF